MKEFVIIIISIIIILIIKFVYDLVIKPIFLKQQYVSFDKQWQKIIEEATNSRENLRQLLKLLLQSNNEILKKYYEKLRIFDKKELSKIEIEKFNELLKELKQHIK